MTKSEVYSLKIPDDTSIKDRPEVQHNPIGYKAQQVQHIATILPIDNQKMLGEETMIKN